jgi:hypothetical protein
VSQPTPAYPPPAPSRRKPWTIVAIVVGSLLALCCAGGGVIGYFVYQGAKQIGPATNATRVFIQDLQTGAAADAYQHLCASTRATFPEPQFASIVAAEPHITSYKITGGDVSDVNGEQTAAVTARLTRAGGAVDHHTFLLKRENGQWLVCGQPY